MARSNLTIKEEELTELDRLIVAGQGETARAKLMRLPLGSLARASRLPCARLARRVGAAELALKILGSVVRPPSRKPADPSPEERLEYAAALAQAGAADEALDLLSGIDASDHPQALLFRSFAHFSRWEYAPTVPLLTSYVAHPGIKRYERLVGMINLASALIFEREHVKAEALLSRLLHEASTQKRYLLMGNALELASANCVIWKKPAKARPFLRQARELLKSTPTVEPLLVDKWEALADFVEMPEDPARRRALEAVRERAIGARFWEAVRDIDRARAVGLRDARLAAHVHFGTPFESFRGHLRRDLGALPLPDTYDWRPGGDGDGPVVETLAGGAPFLKPNQVPSRLFRALCGDFYKPLRLASLHELVFPGEYFNPTSSPQRLHFAAHRLREWFRKEGLPLRIEEESGMYRLRAEPGCAVRIPSGASGGKYAREIARLEAAFGKESFSQESAARVLELPKRTVQRLLSASVQENLLERMGSGKSIRYRKRAS